MTNVAKPHASGNSRTPSSRTDNTVGTSSEPEGAKYLTFICSDDFQGTILGTTRVGNGVYNFGSSEGMDRLGEINYEIMTGSITIDRLD